MEIDPTIVVESCVCLDANDIDQFRMIDYVREHPGAGLSSVGIRSAKDLSLKYSHGQFLLTPNMW